MSEIGKFQLPPIRGTDVFPETIQAPPIVRASVRYNVDPDKPYRPEVLADYAKNTMSKYSSEIGHFLQSQRQNYNAGVVDFAKTTRSHPAFDISYSNNQGKHEIVNITIKMDIGRYGEEPPPEIDFMTLMVLHDGNRLTAFSMSVVARGEISPIYTTECRTSSWSNVKFDVNQLRLGGDYSVIASPINLANNQIVETDLAVVIATDNFEKSLNAWVTISPPEGYGAPPPYPMNGSNDTIYLRGTDVVYDPIAGILTTRPGAEKTTPAVTDTGTWVEDTTSKERAVYHVNSIAEGKSGSDIRDVVLETPQGSATITATGTAYRFTSSSTGQECGILSTITASPEPINSTQSYDYTKEAIFDGIPLGSALITSETREYTGQGQYIVTTTYTYGPIPIDGIHPLTGQIGGGKGDGAYVGPFNAGGGYTQQDSLSNTAENYSQTVHTPGGFPNPCGIRIGPFDWAAGGPWNITDESVNAAVAAAVTEYNTKCVTCNLTSVSVSSSGPYSGSYTVKQQNADVSNIGSGSLITWPYAANDKIYYKLRLGQFDPAKAYSPYDQSGDDITGYFNLSNGEHILQGFEVYTEDEDKTDTYIIWNGDDITSDLATACETTKDSINAIFMDIPFSKVQLFD